MAEVYDFKEFDSTVFDHSCVLYVLMKLNKATKKSRKHPKKFVAFLLIHYDDIIKIEV